MADEMAAKLRRLEHHRDLGDPRTLSSFRMEDLPLEIQPLVMSLLSPKEAARTSIVARNWRNLWTCYPNLCFTDSNDWSSEQDCIKIRREKFIETVNSIINQHSGIGLNKFSIRFTPQKESLDHLDGWICFATASKARIIDIDMWPKKSLGPITKIYNFPLEVLGAHDGPFIQSLLLKDVSIKPHSDICGFRTIRRLVLHCVQIIGDLPGLLSNCCALEDFELFRCYGMVNLNVPGRLNKLKCVRIFNVIVRSIDFHVTGLTHFEYKGDVIPIVLHGCSKLEKATIEFQLLPFEGDKNPVGHVFTTIPTISAVKELNVHADMTEACNPVWAPQAHTLMTRPALFAFLRRLTCETIIYTDYPNNHDGVLRFAYYLDRAPQLEVLELHMLYLTVDRSCWAGKATGELVPSFIGLQRLKAVYMSGFRCYRAQVELLCGILEKGAALEDVTIQPIATIKIRHSMNSYIRERQIREWLRRTARRFGKTIKVV